MPILEAVTVVRDPPEDDEDDEDEVEEWVATDDGGFRCLAQSTPSPKRPQRRTRLWWLMSLLVAGLAVVIGRSSLFWCGARGIPLGTFFRHHPAQAQHAVLCCDIGRFQGRSFH